MSAWMRCFTLGLCGFGFLIAFGSSARADFELDSQTMSIDPQSQVADFSLTFNQAPNFTTLDSLGRPENSFQINFNGNYNPASTAPLQDALTSVIRGDEIHLANSIPIRQPDGNGGPNSGGWGPVVDAVPFSLIGDTLSFSVPTADLGWTGHDYQYDAFSLVDGGQTASHVVTVVPTPRALTSGIAGLMFVAGLSRFMQRRSARQLS